jgi:4-hydroxybutyrate CoA-transferase
MLKIGVKYCGGCNPVYDRVEMIQRIQSHFKDRYLFIRYDEPGIDAMILINGCHRVCSIHDLPPLGISSYSITGENDFKNLIDYLLSLDEKGDRR